MMAKLITKGEIGKFSPSGFVFSREKD